MNSILKKKIPEEKSQSSKYGYGKSKRHKFLNRSILRLCYPFVDWCLSSTAMRKSWLIGSCFSFFYDWLFKKLLLSSQCVSHSGRIEGSKRRNVLTGGKRMSMQTWSQSRGRKRVSNGSKWVRRRALIFDVFLCVFPIDFDPLVTSRSSTP